MSRRTDTGDDVDLRPVIDPDPFDIRVALAGIVHWADSQQVRQRMMAAIDFPVADLSMFLVVNQLTYRGATKPSVLAAALGTGRANLTKIANRLEDIGLVVRVPAPTDDRSVLLALTTTGREYGERISAQLREDLDIVLAHWSAKDVEALRRVLARLRHDAMSAARN
jgi:DNA-binding MarR family transcriptional regulator